MTQTQLVERLAWTYAFRWGEGERTVLLLHAAPDTYRVIYDPRATLSSEVIGTLAIEA